MEKKDYARLAIKTVIVMTIIFFAVAFFVAFMKFKPSVAATWHYFAIFLNVMIAGGVFFRQRVLWELYDSHYEDERPLTTYLLAFSWLIIVMFFVSFWLYPKGLWKIIIPEPFEHLFGYPALISGITQTILTIVGWVLRVAEKGDAEEEEYPC